MEVAWGWQVGCGGPKHIGTHQNVSKLWLKAWGRLWHMGTYGYGVMDEGTARVKALTRTQQ